MISTTKLGFLVMVLTITLSLKITSHHSDAQLDASLILGGFK
jgi:hypothetical protein